MMLLTCGFDDGVLWSYPKTLFVFVSHKHKFVFVFVKELIFVPKTHRPTQNDIRD